MPAFSKTLKESLVITIIGVVFALAANKLSPRGLSLTRNYFPQSPSSSRLQPPHTPTTQEPTNADATLPRRGSSSPLQARLAEKGLQSISHQKAVQLYRDVRFAQGLIVFVDARDDKHFQAGHVPGAHQFDHYRMENYVQDVLAICQAAEQVVVYCNGGDCEDSVFAATDLLELGVAGAKLLIYEGGINEWKRDKMPIETSHRPSENVTKP